MSAKDEQGCTRIHSGVAWMGLLTSLQLVFFAEQRMRNWRRGRLCTGA